MGSPNLPLAIGSARDRTIERLSAHFANDRLSIDELDARLERAYAATSLAELDALTADLPETQPVAHVERQSSTSRAIERYEGPSRIRAIMSETRRGGLWVVPPELDVRAVMANITLDLRSAMLSPGVTDIEVKALMASVQILLPPGVGGGEKHTPVIASGTHDSDTDR